MDLQILEHIYNTLTISYEKSKTFSFSSSNMKNIVVFYARPRFPVKLISWIAFDQYLVLVVYLNLWQSNYKLLWSNDNPAESSCKIIFLTSSNFVMFSNAFMLFFTGCSKKFYPWIMTLKSFIFTLGTKYSVNPGLTTLSLNNNTKFIWPLKTWIN